MKTINNQIKLIGNLGKDLNVREFKSGSKKVEGALATNHSYKNNKGEFVKSTQWHRLVGWNNIAELMGKALTKGTKVAITGSIKYRSYENKEGITKYITEIIVSEFMKVADAVINDNIQNEELVPF